MEGGAEMKTGYPESQEVTIYSLKSEYLQNADCEKDDVSDHNSITVEAKYSPGGGFYYLISTERWAVDDPKELIELVNDFIKRLEAQK
jgi:hypothetical protein